MPHDVFISYSSQDREVADAVCAALEQAGLACWMAPRDIMPGQDYGEAIVDGIKDSRVFVLVVSSSSIDSPQVRREAERAVNADLHVLPFRIEDVQPSRSLEYFISSAHWLDALTPPLAPHLDYLVAAVRRLLDSGEASTGRQLTAPPRPLPARRKGPSWLPLILAGAVGVAGIAAVSAWWGQRPAGRSCTAVPDVSRTIFVDRATPRRGDKPLWLRATPSPTGRRITAIGPDEIFRIAPDRSSPWWAAQLCDGTSGFVAGRFVSVLDRAPPPVAGPPAP